MNDLHLGLPIFGWILLSFHWFRWLLIGLLLTPERFCADMTPTNEKLKDRAVRILTDLYTAADSGTPKYSAEEIHAALEAAGWVMLEARKRLEDQ